MEQRCIICGKFINQSPKRGRGRLKEICDDIACKRKRKRDWQASKLRTDPDYRANQKAAQKQWNDTHPDYWKNYRSTHKEYTESNRQQQRLRSGRKRDLQKGADSGSPIAKMDELPLQAIGTKVVESGRYFLRRVFDGVAKMDELEVELVLIQCDG